MVNNEIAFLSIVDGTVVCPLNKGLRGAEECDDCDYCISKDEYYVECAFEQEGESDDSGS